jgi:periplasmic divalent cation tolerance protein
MTGILQVTTATQTRDQALTLVTAAVEQRLAASAQVSGPVVSAFWHLDRFGTGEEWSAVLLTTQEKYADLESFILAHHPWDNPQLIAVAVEAAPIANIDWVHKAVGQPD